METNGTPSPSGNKKMANFESPHSFKGCLALHINGADEDKKHGLGFDQHQKTGETLQAERFRSLESDF